MAIKSSTRYTIHLNPSPASLLAYPTLHTCLLQQDFFNQLAPIATACFEAGNLYMRASGGGGAGVVVAPPQAPIS